MIKIEGNILDIHGDRGEIIMQMYHLFSALIENNNAEILAALFLTFEAQLRTKVDDEDKLKAAYKLMEILKEGEDTCR